MRWLLPIVLSFACAPRGERAPVEHRGAGDSGSLPCGARTVEELDPSGRTSVGACVVVEAGPLLELREDGRPVLLGGEAKPRVALDPRIPGPHGVRVGMTAAELEARLPGHRHARCVGFGDMLQCELRRGPGRDACGGADDDAVFVRYAAPRREGEVIAGAAAWEEVRARVIDAVVLVMPC